MSDEKITIIVENQKIILKAGFVGGLMGDFTNAPMGMYSGKLDFGETSMALIHLLRAVIKMNTEEQNMNIEQSKAFIAFALDQAIKKEKENLNIDNATLDQHEIILKMRRDKPGC